MALVTSKSDWMAEKALVHVGLAELIPGDRRLRHLREPQAAPGAGRAGPGAARASAPSNALFVGDSPHDVQSGRAAGVTTVGVTWGAFDRATSSRRPARTS